MRKSKTFLIILIVFCGNNLNAQNLINSPYSRFGVGDLQSNVSPQFAAMGGTSIASYNPNILNPYNPASYTTFKPNSFIFSTGGSHKTTNMFTTDLDQTTNYTSFSHLILGFPLTKKMGASAGIIPFSNIGYVLEDDTLLDNIGLVNYEYNGDGGLNVLYVGTAYRLSENLSLGANANYLFGRLDRNSKVIFNDDESFNTRTSKSISIKGFYYQLGLLYSKEIDEKKHITIGITANNNTEISAKESVITETYDVVSSIYEVVKDTTENTTFGFTNSMLFPQNIAFGISFNMDKKWLLAADYSTRKWSDYRIFGETDELINSSSFSGGLQYTPDYNAINKYWKLIKYRFGGKFAQSYLQLNNTQLTEKSISLGFGLPLRKTKSDIDLSVEMGQRGTVNKSLIKEQFLRFRIGLNLKDIWFVKRKYD